MTDSPFFHAHAHSRFSTLDGMSTVERMVELAVKHEQPGLALTDHGVMSGCLLLYRQCVKSGVKPFPGCEMYLTGTLEKSEPRYHLTVLALDFDGYKALVELNHNSWYPAQFEKKTNKWINGSFYSKPRIGLQELLGWGEKHGRHVAVLTGCYFGLLVQSLVDNRTDKVPLSVLSLLKKSFPNLYVEVQMHETTQQDGTTDLEIAERLYQLAVKRDLLMVATQDCHYSVPSDKPVHEMMKRLGYFSSDESEILFPGDSYHLSSTSWVEKHYKDIPDVWEVCLAGFDDLLMRNQMTMPSIDNYKFRVPQVSRWPDQRLRRETEQEMEKRGLTDWQHYTDRLNYELKIIKDTGFGNYFLILADLLRFCHREGIIVNTRGSANGSLVCFLFGITQIDPLVWQIGFDRFLHPSRKKPPDIDLDIERDRRHEVLAYLKTRYQTMPIGTFSRMGATEERGSVFVKYLSYKREVLGKEGFAASEFHGIDSLWQLDRIAPEDARVLKKLAKMEVYQSRGVHAAGVVLTTDEFPLIDYVPQMYIASSKTLCTQMTMDEIESAGYVKMDALGLAALTTLAACCDMIGKPKHPLDWIPLEDKKVLRMMSDPRETMGVFQYEGYSTVKGSSQMKLTSVQDAIFCLALFRPAAMASGHTKEYLSHRSGMTKPRYIHSVFERHTRETFGVFVLQDQVIDLIRAIGMSHEDVNDLLKAVKQSNDRGIREANETFDRLAYKFIKSCQERGMTNAQARAGWEQIRGFSDYGFNRAHATSYGLLAYRLAWLKFYHPKEFMCATLQTWAGEKKEPQYQAEARRLGFTIRKPDPNVSVRNWTRSTTSNELFRGLITVKGIGEAGAAKLIENAPYRSKADLLKRAGKVNHDALENAGCLERLKDEHRVARKRRG